MAMRTSPAATAAPDPDDDPPVKWSRFQGLRAGGNGRSKLGPPIANSCVASLPSRTAPPLFNLASTTQSLLDNVPSKDCVVEQQFRVAGGGNAGRGVDVLE